MTERNFRVQETANLHRRQQIESEKEKVPLKNETKNYVNFYVKSEQENIPLMTLSKPVKRDTGLLQVNHNTNAKPEIDECTDI